MTGIPYLCFDGDSGNNIAPHRPAIEHVGRNDYLDQPGEDVDSRYGWAAIHGNQMCQVVPQLAKMSSMIEIAVRFSGGAPQVHSSKQCRTLPVTISPTDNGTGDTSLTWPANSFAPSLIPPRACVNVVLGSAAGYATTEEITNGVRVRCYNTAGTLSDLPFTVSVG